MSLQFTPQWDKPIACIRHRRTYPDNRPKESGCPYEVPDLRAHLAICAKVAENRKLAKCPLNEDGMEELRAILNGGKGLTNKQALQAYEVLAYWRANYHDAKARLAEKPKRGRAGR